MSGLTIRALHAVPVKVPMNYALGTSAATVRAAPLLLVDLETHEGITGRAYQFCYVPAAARAIIAMLAEMFEAVRNKAVAPSEIWARLTRRYTLDRRAGDHTHVDGRCSTSRAWNPSRRPRECRSQTIWAPPAGWGPRTKAKGSGLHGQGPPGPQTPKALSRAEFPPVKPPPGATKTLPEDLPPPPKGGRHPVPQNGNKNHVHNTTRAVGFFRNPSPPEKGACEPPKHFL